ncbi:MAG: response regulator [Magnetococcus sp. XQGC-1]
MTPGTTIPTTSSPGDRGSPPPAELHSAILTLLQQTEHPQHTIIRHTHLFTTPLNDPSGQKIGLLLGIAHKEMLEHRSALPLLLAGALFNLCLLVLFWFMKKSNDLQHALERALATAENANRAKSAFLATMSHEIRTPMNAIIGLNSLALQHALHPKTRDCLRRMHTTSHALLRILNDILDISKIEAGKLNMESVPFQLVEIFEHLGNLFRHQGENSPVELVLVFPSDLLLEMVGDPLRLEQVLVNLVSNGLKFTQAGSVVVQVQPLEQDEHSLLLQFSVQDTGIGLSPEQQERLFQAFSQAESSTARHFGGSGLGLAISKQLVERMGGGIRVESREGEGSRFYFTARFGLGQKPSHPPLRCAETLRGLPVLVVDDHPMARQALQATLHAFGLSVTAVGSGAEALATLRQANTAGTPFALLLLDAQMPEMDGLATAAAIRGEPALSHTLTHLHPPAEIPKILLMAPFTGDEYQKRGKQLGLDGFIEKPFSRLLLFDTIQELFGPEGGTRQYPLQLTEVTQHVRERIAGARVLLVDDVSINREVVRETLEQMGLVVEWADNGREAVRRVLQGEKSFAIVLMDLEMPEMDGYETTRAIRQEPAQAQLPIIAMTAHAMEGVWAKCQAAGMNAYLAKPIDGIALCKLLLRWIPEERASAATVTARPQEKGEENRLPSFLPGIDVAAALQRMNSNPQLLHSQMVAFHQDFSAAARTIRDALDDGQERSRQRARIVAHTIKGAAGNLSADALFQSARNLEDAIHAQRQEHWPELLDRFEQDLAQVIRSIQTVMEKTLHKERDNREG